MDYPHPPVKRRNGISLAAGGSLASTIGLRSVLFENSMEQEMVLSQNHREMLTS